MKRQSSPPENSTNSVISSPDQAKRLKSSSSGSPEPNENVPTGLVVRTVSQINNNSEALNIETEEPIQHIRSHEVLNNEANTSIETDGLETTRSHEPQQLDAVASSSSTAEPRENESVLENNVKPNVDTKIGIKTEIKTEIKSEVKEENEAPSTDQSTETCSAPTPIRPTCNFGIKCYL